MFSTALFYKPLPIFCQIILLSRKFDNLTLTSANIWSPIARKTYYYNYILCGRSFLFSMLFSVVVPMSAFSTEYMKLLSLSHSFSYIYSLGNMFKSESSSSGSSSSSSDLRGGRAIHHFWVMTTLITTSITTFIIFG